MTTRQRPKTLTGTIVIRGTWAKTLAQDLIDVGFADGIDIPHDRWDEFRYFDSSDAVAEYVDPNRWCNRHCRRRRGRHRPVLWNIEFDEDADDTFPENLIDVIPPPEYPDEIDDLAVEEIDHVIHDLDDGLCAGELNELGADIINERAEEFLGSDSL
ncbi:MAG: hypothetical protein R6V19_06515 [Armatimonadota bacterium]